MLSSGDGVRDNHAVTDAREPPRTALQRGVEPEKPVFRLSARPGTILDAEPTRVVFHQHCEVLNEKRVRGGLLGKPIRRARLWPIFPERRVHGGRVETAPQDVGEEIEVGALADPICAAS